LCRKFEIENEDYVVTIDETRNEKGLMMTVFKNQKLFLVVRVMHRSSGAEKYREDFDYYRINVAGNASFFVDENGSPSQNLIDTHIAWKNCSDFENTFLKIFEKYTQKIR
jgi:hypothetical protein